MAGFVGKWKMTNSENFDEYMKVLGVGLVMRKAGNSAKPTVTFSVDGDKWKIVTSTTFTTTEVEFTLGQEFEETTADGRKVKSVFTLDGNKLIHEQKGEVDSTLVRELNGDTYVMTCTAKGVTATRSYERA